MWFTFIQVKTVKIHKFLVKLEDLLSLFCGLSFVLLDQFACIFIKDSFYNVLAVFIHGLELHLGLWTIAATLSVKNEKWQLLQSLEKIYLAFPFETIIKWFHFLRLLKQMILHFKHLNEMLLFLSIYFQLILQLFDLFLELNVFFFHFKLLILNFWQVFPCIQKLQFQFFKTLI